MIGTYYTLSYSRFALLHLVIYMIALLLFYSYPFAQSQTAYTHTMNIRMNRCNKFWTKKIYQTLQFTHLVDLIKTMVTFESTLVASTEHLFRSATAEQELNTSSTYFSSSYWCWQLAPGLQGTSPTIPSGVRGLRARRKPVPYAMRGQWPPVNPGQANLYTLSAVTSIQTFSSSNPASFALHTSPENKE